MKRVYLQNVIEYITLIILFIINSDKLYLYTLIYLLYKMLSSMYNNIDIGDSVKKYKKDSNILNNKVYVYSIGVLFIYSLFNSILLLVLGLIINKVMGINIILPLVISSLNITCSGYINITYQTLLIYNKKKLSNTIYYIYVILSNILLLFIYSVFYKIDINILTTILFIPRIITILLIISLILIIFYKGISSKYNINGIVRIFKYMNKYLTIKDSIKYSYFYISYILVYILLKNKYGYDNIDINYILTASYLFSLSIILLICDSIRYIYRNYVSLYKKIFNMLDRGISICILFMVISKYIYMFIFGNIDNYSILSSFSILIPFISIYDTLLLECKNINKYLVLSIIIMGLSQIVLIDSFYRMGYNLINGSITSIVIVISILIMVMLIKVRNLSWNMISKYFEEIIILIYYNIIFSFVLVSGQLFIKGNSRILSVLVIVIYIVIITIHFKIKKRGIKNE